VQYIQFSQEPRESEAKDPIPAGDISTLQGMGTSLLWFEMNRQGLDLAPRPGLNLSPHGQTLRQVRARRNSFQSNKKGISMKSIFAHCICRILIVCLAAFPFSTYAGMVGTDQVVAAAQSQGARDKVLSFINRSEVRSQLQNFGVSPATAQARVNAMTDTEVAGLAGQIDSLPAGGNDAWVVVGVLVLIGLIWYFWVK
jgi:hypothetical protein